MKILLIDPPYRLDEIGGKRQNFKYVLNNIPTLGLAYLAAVAEKEGHTVKIIDPISGLGNEEIIEIAEDFGPRIIGITATTPTFKNALFVASLLRKVLPEAVYVCGGPHPTACPEDALNSGVFDFLVLGEGENTFLEIISYIETGRRSDSPKNISGIAFKQDGRTIITSPRPRIDDLDSLPLPARHLLPPLKAHQPTPASYRKLPLAVIMTSRGCPSRCTFCDRSVFGEKLRKRSVSNVMEEVEEVVSKFGAKEIRFFDDTFTLDHGHVEGICKAMGKLRPSIPWTCLTRVTSVNPSILKLMRESGCWQVLFGLESGDDYVLKHLGKGNTVKQNKEAVFWARQAGLRIRADFLVGSPWETKESFNKTVEFAKKLPLDFAHFNKFVPFPGTRIYKDLISKGYKIDFNNGSFINNHSDFVYIPEAFSKSEYTAFLNRSYRKFYLRPGYILRRLLSIRTFTEFIGHLKGLRSILSL